MHIEKFGPDPREKEIGASGKCPHPINLYLYLIALEYKFDIILKDPSPLVGSSSPEDYRIYVTWQYRSATVFEIGRSADTGTGVVGSGYKYPEPSDNVPNGSGLPPGTQVVGKSSESANWKRLEFKFPPDAGNARIGAFYAKTFYNEDPITITTVKTSETGKLFSILIINV